MVTMDSLANSSDELENTCSLIVQKKIIFYCGNTLGYEIVPFLREPYPILKGTIEMKFQDRRSKAFEKLILKAAIFLRPS